MNPRHVIVGLSLLVVLLAGVLTVYVLRSQSPSAPSGVRPTGETMPGSGESPFVSQETGEAGAWLEVHDRMQRLSQRVDALEARPAQAGNTQDGISLLTNRLRNVESRLEESQRALHRLDSRLASERDVGGQELEQEVERLRRQVRELERPDSVRHLEEMLSEMQRSLDTLRSDLYRLKLDVQSLDSR